ncbi:hypothetical protein CCUS01_13920, partial [Colletotrichum cuscutae]
ILFVCFKVLPLPAARAVLDIVFTVLIHRISEYSHCLNKLFFLDISTFPTFPPAKFTTADH